MQTIRLPPGQMKDSRPKLVHIRNTSAPNDLQYSTSSSLRCVKISHQDNGFGGKLFLEKHVEPELHRRIWVGRPGTPHRHLEVSQVPMKLLMPAHHLLHDFKISALERFKFEFIFFVYALVQQHYLFPNPSNISTLQRPMLHSMLCRCSLD